MKQCITCNQIKDETEFYNRGKTKSRPNRTGLLTECKPCTRERTKRNSTPEQKRYHMVNFKYGLSKTQYDALLVEFPVCGSCKRAFKKQEPYVDHNHKTGAIRGLLCHGCNSGLGGFEDNPELLCLAIAYLEKYNT